ncbi:MAG: VOC family protein [Gammaproteobacteria bacterium]|jgi:catechol 2,3-dioxygenase-like lactoylglutathione lyase family enzyme
MQDTETQLDSLHHVAIQTKDIARALKWYSENFNSELVYQDDTWALLRFQNIYLALVVPGQHPPHIAIEHEAAATYGTLTRHRDGTESIYINDSEGNTIELMKPVSSTTD